MASRGEIEEELLVHREDRQRRGNRFSVALGRISDRISGMEMGSRLWWAKAADAICMVILAVGFACSLYLLSNPSFHTACRTSTATSTVWELLMEAAMKMVPIVLMGVMCYSTRLIRDAVGTPQPASLSFLNGLCAIAIMGWLGICMLGAPEVAVLLTGSAMAVVAAVATVLVAPRGGEVALQ